MLQQKLVFRQALRAILSWETPPPSGDPNYIPTWGNREETLVFIAPGKKNPENTHTPLIETIGSMGVADIDNASGLANGSALLAGFTAKHSPFAGQIIFTGHLANPTDISAGADDLEYKVMVSRDGVNWQTIDNAFTIYRHQLLNGVWSAMPSVLQTAPGGWYKYQEDLSGGPGNAQIFVSGNVLARWYTGSGMDGLWHIKIKSRVSINPAVEWTSSTKKIMIDNTDPARDISITSGAGACSDVKIGDVISGKYKALDDHFYKYKLSIAPANGGTFTVNPSGGGSFGSPSPLTRLYSTPGVPDTGEHGTWDLDTTGMPQCGYIVYITVWDRAIINSGSACSRYRTANVGLCLRKK